MSPITHFLASWGVANAAELDRKDRAIITLAGVIPDIDGFGIVAEVLTRNWERPLTWFSDDHHLLGHNPGFCLLVTTTGFLLATRRRLTAALALASFQLHLLEDLIGARGPDGHQWPIPYLLPFSKAWELTWQGQWALNAWPNFAITGTAMGLTLYLARQRGYSPVEMFSSRAEKAFIKTLRRRFPKSTSGE